MAQDTHDKTSSLNPFGRVNELMTKVVEEQVQHAQTMGAEWQKMSAHQMKQAQTSMQDMSALMKTTMEYQAGLMQEWQKLSMDVMRQMMPAKG